MGLTDEVRIIDNRNDNNNRDSVTGIVTDVRSDRRFTLRANNRSYDVVSSSRLPRNISEGDRVRVDGDVRNGSITDAAVNVVSNNDNGYGNGGNDNNFNVNFPATVIDSSERNNTLRVRGENGREYLVRTNEAEKWDRGDRVRIKGRSQNGVIIANDIDRR